MTLVNRMMRFEVALLVETLIVSQVSQMTNGNLLAKRFANISMIKFQADSSGGDCCIHAEGGFAHQLIPFLQAFGRHLERVAFSDALKT